MIQEEDRKTKRISVTLPPSFLRCLEELSERGVFLDRGAVIRAGMRTLFAIYGLYPFKIEGDEDEDEVSYHDEYEAYIKKADKILEALTEIVVKMNELTSESIALWVEYLPKMVHPEYRDEVSEELKNKFLKVKEAEEKEESGGDAVVE